MEIYSNHSISIAVTSDDFSCMWPSTTACQCAQMPTHGVWQTLGRLMNRIPPQNNVTLMNASKSYSQMHFKAYLLSIFINR